MHSRRRDPAWPSQFFSSYVMFEVVEISRACFIQLHADARSVDSLVSLQLSVMTLCFAIHGDCLISIFSIHSVHYLDYVINSNTGQCKSALPCLCPSSLLKV